jgi:hypothetical protein
VRGRSGGSQTPALPVIPDKVRGRQTRGKIGKGILCNRKCREWVV